MKNRKRLSVLIILLILTLLTATVVLLSLVGHKEKETAEKVNADDYLLVETLAFCG